MEDKRAFVSFITLKAPASAELVEKKSRFIGYAAPVADEAAAQAFLQEIRARHRDATHNCYAYQAGEADQFQRSSDDGEPAGTAGRPILEVIRGRGLKNTAVVVTRYFGGILLGTGGLVRAYSAAARAAVEAAGLVRCRPAQLWGLAVDYSLWQRLEAWLAAAGYEVQRVAYSDRVDVQFAAPVEAAAALPVKLAELLGAPPGLLLLADDCLLSEPV